MLFTWQVGLYEDRNNYIRMSNFFFNMIVKLTVFSNQFMVVKTHEYKPQNYFSDLLE